MIKLEKYTNQAYAALRIMSGWMLAFHGMQGLFGIWSPFKAPFPSQMWIGLAIQFLGGIAVALGIRTRWVAFVLSGEMAVAYFQFHWKFALNRHFFPQLNEGELAVLYCFIFLYIACRGGGPYAIARD